MPCPSRQTIKRHGINYKVISNIIVEVQMLETNTNNPSGLIQSIIAADITAYAKEFNLPIRQVMQEINSNTKVSISTLERIVTKPKSPLPFPRTVVSIYSYILKTKSLSEIIIKTPTEVSDYINKNRVSFSKSEEVLDFDVKKEEELTSDDLFNQIYNMTSGDFGTDIVAVKYQYGIEGLKKLDAMILDGYVTVDEDERLKRGKSLSWNRRTMVNFTKTLGNRIKKMEDFDLDQENYCLFQTWTVTFDDSIKIKEIMKTAARSAMELAKNSKPRETDFKNLSFSTLIASTDMTSGDKQ